MDGSGKTTHISRLMKELRKRGFRVKYVWCRWVPGFADPFHFLIRKTLGYTAGSYKFFKPLQIVYQFLIILDYSVAIAFKVRLSAIPNDCILLIDRYVYDALADLDFIRFSISTFFRRLFITMNPKPDITFLIDVPPDVACSRKNDLQLPQATKYRNIYHKLAKIYRFRTIINMDFSEAHDRILGEVLKIIK